MRAVLWLSVPSSSWNIVERPSWLSMSTDVVLSAPSSSGNIVEPQFSCTRIHRLRWLATPSASQRLHPRQSRLDLRIAPIGSATRAASPYAGAVIPVLADFTATAQRRWRWQLFALDHSSDLHDCCAHGVSVRPGQR